MTPSGPRELQLAPRHWTIPPAAVSVPPSSVRQGSLARAMTAVVRDCTGRGPERICVTAGEDVVCVVMHGNHTKGEQALLAAGEHALVADLRRGYHRAMLPALLAAAGGATGRDVEVILADHDPRADVSTFNVVLAPRVARQTLLREAPPAARDDGAAELAHGGASLDPR